MIEGPSLENGVWTWKDRRGPVEVRFTGKGPDGSRDEVLGRIEPASPSVAWARQIHSALALPAQPGACGEGDALFTDQTGLALSVITADCVPILLAGPGGLAAIHAGWRGIVGGVVSATLQKLAGPFAEWTAWIGPSIGLCCYEVGDDVASQVVAASGPQVLSPGPTGRPHLDLQMAVRRQLERAGVGEVVTVQACTRCDEERLWSYRREGKRAGRNMGFVWVLPPT